MIRNPVLLTAGLATLALALPAPAAQAGLLLGTCGSERACIVPDDGSAPPREVHVHVEADGAFTPDGQRIVATSDEPIDLGGQQRPGIVSVRLDGTDYRILQTTIYRQEHDIRVSPDGRFFSFVAYPWSPSLDHEVAYGSLEGSESGSLGRGTDARWRPDGGGVFAIDNDIDGDDRENDVYSTDLGERNRRRLTLGGMPGGDAGRGRDSAPVFSPDGRSVAFDTTTPAGRVAIYVMSTDGTGVRRLTSHGVQDHKPFWSADSRRILFVRKDRSGRSGVYTVDVATRRVTRLPDTVNGSRFEPANLTDWYSGPVAPVAPAADRVAPGVQLLGTDDGTARRASLLVSLYDRSGVTRLSMAADGRRPVAIASQAAFQKAVRRLRPGTHRLVFRTRDGAGNARRQAFRLRLR